MSQDLLENIKKRMNLRKLGYASINLKNNILEKKLVIGFSLNSGSLSFKANILTDIPNESFTEEQIEDYIRSKISIFEIKTRKDVQRAIHVLNILSHDKKNKLTNEFKNSFTGALSDYTSDDVKMLNIQKAFKRTDKKLKIMEKVVEEETKIKSVIDDLQIREYHTYFSLARNVKRKIKLYIGPTNSGKTYHALNDLADHERGCYLSPLRLLAWEGKEELEKRGKPTSLITGEEKQIVEGADFKSQTIETLNFSEETDAILIDEIQMIYDKERGWAWTQAIIGAPCKELIIAGSPESESIVRKIAELLGEDLEIVRLDRFNPLEVNAEPYDLPKDINKLPEGTALIAFSRKNVLAIKKALEEKGKKVSVIYGNLSPEVRREEAIKFQNGTNKYLVATNAIGMGLNLSISNIVFTAVEKFNGYETEPLSATEVKQIAGRAGRFGKFEKGFVSAMDKQSLKYIRTMINGDDKINDFLYIKPSLEHVKRIGAELKTTQLFPILTFFANKVMSNKKDLYVCSNLDDQKEVALIVDKVKGLSLEDKFLFNTAPVPGEDHYEIYLKWIQDYHAGKHVPAPNISILNPKNFKHEKLLILENYVKLLNLYSWLSYKKYSHFTEHDLCLDRREDTNKKIEEILSSTKNTERLRHERN